MSSYDNWLQEPYQEFFSQEEEVIEFEDYLDETFTKLGEYNGEVVWYCQDWDEAFIIDKSVEPKWAVDRYNFESEEIGKTELVEMIIKLKNGDKDESSSK